MQTNPTRRTFLAGGTAAGIVAVAGCTGDTSDTEEAADNDTENGADDDTENGADGQEDVEYEVWALDQGQDNIHLYEPGDGEDEFEESTTIDLNELEGVPEEGVVPHMIDFSSDYEYAAVACTAGERVLVFRTDGCELVGNVETGAGSHMAIFSPDDEYIHVDVIGESKIVRVDADLEDEEFDIEDEIVVDGEIEGLTGEEGAPICHQFDHNGRSIHTLGPSYHDGGLVIVDHDEFTVDAAFSNEELPTNCGTMPHPEENKFYLTAGLPSDPEADEEPAASGVGAYYVLDADEDEIIVEEESTEGVDAHGFWFTPDGEELWVLNRETNDGVVVDPETDEVIEEIDAYGENQSDDPAESDAPDIMWSSPDGEYMFVSLRGPAPLSGDPHAATGVIPGFSVLDVESREIVATVEPDPIGEYDEEEIQAAQDEEEDAPSIPDFHGLGVRPVGDVDSEIPNSPPF
ncbi:cell surface protein [Natronococcus pandeyae]|uniref:Cell surface protein n=1 Tax=Natronococcus pandeyae TaxID=2055836 RepID=A0A8J8Q442_9EURY|nr:cell surface protein [Natronococcus pandeyae]TYL38852.1 cell surface protein [Natronococcus pandeyae]